MDTTKLYPEQPGSVKCFKPAKPIFFSSPPHQLITKQWTAPFGCVSFICEGGGRFDAQPNVEGWQEDSFWVGGYYGPKMEIDEEKVKLALATIPPGTLYVFNVEHWKHGPNATAEQIEDTNRRFRKFFLLAKKVRPDLRYAVYGVAPYNDYWILANYDLGVRTWERYKKEGIAGFTDYDRWCVGLVASNKTDYNVYELDDTKPSVVAYKKWQAKNDLLTLGYRNSGSVVKSWGMTDVVDYFTPSCYDHIAGNDSEAYIKWQCLECKRLDKTKPIFPFIWPNYHDAAPNIGGKPIPLDEWRITCRHVFNYADGAIIWGANEKDHKEHIWVALDEAERSVSKRL